MENEKILLAGGALAAAYFLFGGGGREEEEKNQEESAETNLASQITDNILENLDLTQEEYEDLSGNDSTILEIEDPGGVEEWVEEESEDPYEYQGPSSISAGGGGGGGGGGSEMVDWCGTDITQTQANAYMAQMIARSGPDGHYEENPIGSNCWTWIPRAKPRPGPAPQPQPRPEPDPEPDNGNGNAPILGPSVTTGGSYGWTSGSAPVQVAGGSGTRIIQPNILNWAYGSH